MITLIVNSTYLKERDVVGRITVSKCLTIDTCNSVVVLVQCLLNKNQNVNNISILG